MLKHDYESGYGVNNTSRMSNAFAFTDANTKSVEKALLFEKFAGIISNVGEKNCPHALAE
ncbi:MAG: hypothetical protein J2P36_18020 [Ktedonobacteraceae bacterium]|nr:hypothetical protein [Ktedonobacteraceae bacterium]